MNQAPSNSQILDDYGHLLVRRAIEREDVVADAVLDLLAGTQKEWTLAEWEAVLHTASQDSRRIREMVAA